MKVCASQTTSQDRVVLLIFGPPSRTTPTAPFSLLSWRSSHVCTHSYKNIHVTFFLGRLLLEKLGGGGGRS